MNTTIKNTTLIIIPEEMYVISFSFHWQSLRIVPYAVSNYLSNFVSEYLRLRKSRSYKSSWLWVIIDLYQKKNTTTYLHAYKYVFDRIRWSNDIKMPME